MVRRAVAVLTGAFVLAMVGFVRPALAAPVITVANSSVVEGDTSNVTMVFSVKLSAQSSTVVDVRFKTSDGTATSMDYNAVDTTVKFAIGQTTVNVNVSVRPDKDYEGDETFTVTLSNAVGGTVGTPTAVGTIIENDPAPVLAFTTDIGVVEGTGGTTPAIFTVTLSGRTTLEATVNYATSPVTAKSGADYTHTTGQLRFPVGTSSQTISVPVIGDSLDEPFENFRVTLSAPVAATILFSQAVGGITDDDDAPSASIGDVTVTEGDTGTTTVAVALTFSAPSGYTLSIPYEVHSGSAMAGEDFVASSGSFVLGAETPGPVTRLVTIIGDTLDEPDEHLFVRLGTATNLTITDREALVVIVDDDLRPSTVEAEPIVATIGPAPATVNGSLRATLRDGVTLAPLPGRTITFTSASTSAFLCDAVTDSLGRATCGDPEDIAFALADGGYRAHFGGDSDYMASSGTGPVVATGAGGP